MVHLKRFALAAFIILAAACGTPRGAVAGCGADNPNCIVPTAPPGTSNNQAASTAFVQNAVGSPLLPNNEFFIGGSDGFAHAQTLSGDCTSTNAGVITCTKTNGTSFGTFATQSAPTGVTANCLQANSSGVVAGTGSPCGTGGSGAVNSVSNSDGTLSIAPTTGAVVASLALGHANTWTGAQTFNAATTFTADAYFKSGRPWADVIAWGAACNYSGAGGGSGTDDHAAYQNANNMLSSTYGGGVIFVPPCSSYFTSGISLSANVIINGSGRWVSMISAGSNDINLITINANYAGIYHLGMYGIGSGGTLNTVSINSGKASSTGVNVIIADCNIWGENAALFNNGVDDTIFSDFVAGNAYNLASTGANWYVRTKFDSSAGTAYLQGASFLGITENHFVQCDFSNVTTYSVQINDSTNNAITEFEGSVFSGEISISGAKATMFVDDEFGSTSFASSEGYVLVSNGFFFSSTTVSGASAFRGCGNINVSGITCS